MDVVLPSECFSMEKKISRCSDIRPSISKKCTIELLFADGAKRIRISSEHAPLLTWSKIKDILIEKMRIPCLNNYGFFCINGENAEEVFVDFKESTVHTIHVKRLLPVFCDEPKEGTVPVHVKTLDGRVSTFHMNLEKDTVRNIINKIELQQGIRAFFQSLVYNGIKMQDHLLLSHYNIEANSTICFVLRLRAGPFVEVSARDKSLKFLPILTIYDADKDHFVFG